MPHYHDKGTLTPATVQSFINNHPELSILIESLSEPTEWDQATKLINYMLYDLYLKQK